MNKYLIILSLTSMFLANNASAVTRSCTSSNHQVHGDVKLLVNGKYVTKRMSAIVSVRRSVQKGSHWNPAIARRRSCRKAGSIALDRLVHKVHGRVHGAKNASKYLCNLATRKYKRAIVLSASPQKLSADARHGSENNGKSLLVTGRHYFSCSSTQVRKVFSKPKIGGLALDQCKTWAKHCGRPAATAFCKLKGYKRGAEKYRVLKTSGKTRIIGSAQICDGRYGRCDKITNLTCVK